MTKYNLILIEDSEIEISKKVVANLYVFSEVTIKRGIHIKLNTSLSKELTNTFITLIALRRRHLVNFKTGLFATVKLTKHLLIAFCGIPFTCSLLFPYCHGYPLTLLIHKSLAMTSIFSSFYLPRKPCGKLKQWGVYCQRPYG